MLKTMGFINWFRDLIDKQFFAVIGILLIFIGFFFSRALMSIGMITMCVSALLSRGFVLKLKAFIKLPALWLFMVFFALIAFSGLYSDDLGFFKERLQIKLPFLGLPLAIYFIKPFKRSLYLSLLYVFFIMIVFAVGWSVFQMLQLDYQTIVDSYKVGHVLPTPVHHIRFSLMLVIAFAIGLYLILNKFYWFSPKEHYLIIIGMVIFFIFAHVLAVKTGLLAFYILILVFIIRMIYRTKQYLLGAGIIVALFIIPFVAYKTIDTLHYKVDYFIYDIGQYFSNKKIDTLSDSRRIRSYDVAIEAAGNSPIFGVGYGDIKEACKAVYQKNFPDTESKSWLQPHSQFLYVYVGLGWVGLLFFIVIIVLPLIHKSAYKDLMVLTIALVGIISFFSEHTLETQLGTALYVTFIMLSLTNYYNSFEDDSHFGSNNNP